MTTILGIAGSLRRTSYNKGLLRAAAGLMPDGTVLEIGSIAGVPLYDGDVEAAGIPPAVAALKDEAAAADGLLLVTPEYNNGIPGVFKNTIDWLSRPNSDIARIFTDKPVAVIGASLGGYGTILSQAAWLPVLRTLGADHWAGGRLMVPHAGKAFDEEGDLTDEAIRARLRDYLAGFAAYVRENRPADRRATLPVPRDESGVTAANWLSARRETSPSRSHRSPPPSTA